MRTETKTIKIYKYSELSDKAKKRALDFAREHWSADSWQHEFEQLQYELSEAKNVLVGCPTSELSQWIQDLIKDGSLHSIKCTGVDVGRSQKAEVVFIYNYDAEYEYLESVRDTKLRDINIELENFCLSFMQKAEEYIYSEEYWSDEFEANEREFTEKGDLY